MEHTMIEVNKLEKSPLNARRTAAKGASEEMKASILAHGLMQNLVVTAGGDGRIPGDRRRPPPRGAPRSCRRKASCPAITPCPARSRPTSTPWR